MARKAPGPRGSLVRLLRQKGLAGLTDLDQVPVRIAEIAADLGAAVLRRREELRSAGAPVGIDLLDVRDADVEKAAHPIQVGRRLERDRRLVVSWPATDIDDDPTVRQRYERRLALLYGLAPEHLRVEAARAVNIIGNDEVRQDDALFGCGELGHRSLLWSTLVSGSSQHVGSCGHSAGGRPREADR